MDDITIEAVAQTPALAALQGPTTNALVHNPFSFEAVTEVPALAALQGPTTNALVHNPFSFEG